MKVVALDLCGTLARGVGRINVTSALEAAGLAGVLTEQAYWRMVTATWPACSTRTSAPFREAALAHFAADGVGVGSGDADGSAFRRGFDAFLSEYWARHAVEAEWIECLKAHAHAAAKAEQAATTADVYTAVSASIGHPKKTVAFWKEMLARVAATTTTSSAPAGTPPVVFVVATDHYAEADDVLPRLLPGVRVEKLQGIVEEEGGGSGGGSGLEAVSELIVIDDFGAAEQAAAGYVERRAATEAAIRSVLPPHVGLSVVAVSPEEPTAQHTARLRALLER
eukprot:Rhum_TRINITY_DN14824_c6_g3::Rhum_TRINITY_DN14824_c6_g3_i1::g.119347::m.119347